MNEYKYNITLQYMYNNEPSVIDSKNIISGLVDYNYDDNHMPTIFITASIDKNLVDDMIKNSKTKTITMTITKFISNASLEIEESYVRGEFIYFLTDNLNSTSGLDYSKDTANSQDIYRKISIGMLDQKLINNNKITINDCIENSTLLDTILHYTKSMSLLIEPVNLVNINNFVVPPMNSVSKLINLLDTNFSIYPKNKYRLFYDFDRTYLLSSSGKPIQAKDELYNNIIFKVSDTIEVDNKLQGIDIENNSYVVYVGSDNISTSEDKATKRTSTATVAVGNDGKYAVSGTGDKYKIERSTTNNLNSATVNQSQIENNSFSVNVVKTDLDSSIFTINKSYYIQNYTQLADKNGTFLLSRKREIYTPQGDNFMISNLLTFRKAIV